MAVLTTIGGLKAMSNVSEFRRPVSAVMEHDYSVLQAPLYENGATWPLTSEEGLNKKLIEFKLQNLNKKEKEALNESRKNCIETFNSICDNLLGLTEKQVNSLTVEECNVLVGKIERSRYKKYYFFLRFHWLLFPATLMIWFVSLRSNHGNITGLLTMSLVLSVIIHIAFAGAGGQGILPSNFFKHLKRLREVYGPDHFPRLDGQW